MKTTYRTIFLSDIHLGSKGCQAEKLVSFLQNTESEYLIFCGDIIDFWAMKRQVHWPRPHNKVIQLILQKANSGTKVIYVPGNHDENLKDFCGSSFGNINIEKEYIHTMLSGDKFLCIHGDDFDVVTRYHRWIAILGDIGYEFLLWLNRKLNSLRAKLGMGYWSLSNYIKHKVKQAVQFISEYEENVSKEAKHRSVRGVVCGHIHSVDLREMNGITYINCGDWVESCTAIVEELGGKLTILNLQ